jgi:hypothetical protein
MTADSKTCWREKCCGIRNVRSGMPATLPEEIYRLHENKRTILMNREMDSKRPNGNMANLQTQGVQLIERFA